MYRTNKSAYELFVKYSRWIVSYLSFGYEQIGTIVLFVA